MNLTGKIKKDIYNQTGEYSFNLNLTIPDYTSVVNFGVSGNNLKNLFQYKNGKIYDESGRFIGVYQKNQLSSFSANFNKQNYDVYIDGVPKVIGDVKFSGDTTAFILSGDSIDIDYDFTFYGELPKYHTNSLISFSTGVSSFTGTFFNDSNYPIKVYSGEFLGNKKNFNVIFNSGTISSGGSGNYLVYPSGTNSLGYNLLETKLYTNFGEINLLTSVSGTETLLQNYNIDLSGPNAIPFGYTQAYLGNFFARSGDMTVVAILKNVTGTGISYISVNTSGYYSANATGFISGCGTLQTANLSINGTGSGGFLNNIGTGIITGIVSTSFCPTGTIVIQTSIPFTGLATGIGYTGIGYASFTLPVTGVFTSGDNGVKLVSYTKTGVTFTGPVYSLYPKVRVPSSGYIDYNTPIEAITSDILYVKTIYNGIVYGFHHTNASGLASYLNNNTGLHGVSASYTGGNRIYLQSVPGLESESILLKVDQDNDGNMAVSTPYLTGGYTSGQNSLVTGVSGASWKVDNYQVYITGTGNFSKQVSGYLYSTATVVDNIKLMTGIWSLSTGTSFFNRTQFVGINSVSGIVTNNLTSNFGSVYLYVDYISSYLGQGDVADLYLSGVGASQGTYQSIRITGGLI